MSIVTKKGDRGETHFYQGRRVSKDHIRIESCGKESLIQLSGENPVSGTLDICRTITGRAERRVTTLNRKKFLSNRYILIYLNRLSGLLYLLAGKHAICKDKNLT